MKIAITGIDGSGKSTLTRRIIEKFPQEKQETLVLRCPKFHETPNAPLSDLSKDLDALSAVADRLESFHLKAIAQFIQISLFGPVKTFLIKTFTPDLLINERHPVIDSYAYGYFYISKLGGAINKKELEVPMLQTLHQIRPGAMHSINRWLELESQRLEKDLSFWNYHKYLTQTFTQKGKALIRAIITHTQTTLPDMLLLLDIAADDAVSRVIQRDNEMVELHEQSDMLSQIRALYLDAIDFFTDVYPKMKIRIITTDSSTDVDQTINEISQSLPL